MISWKAVHKETKAEEGSCFTRVINYLMPLMDHNKVNGKLKDLGTYHLTCPFLIVYYYFKGSENVCVHGDTHGNVKPGSTATEFGPREHSLKVECRTKAGTDRRAPRIIAQGSRSRLTFLMLTQIVQLSEILSRLQIAGTYTISLMKNRVVILPC